MEAPPARLVGLLAEVRDRLVALRQRVGEELVADFDDLLDRHDLLSEGEAGMLNPLGQPLLEVALWLVDYAQDQCGTDLGPHLVDLAEATVVGYLHVRVEDDWVDEGIGHRVRAPMLSDAFLVRHQALLARVVGASPRFWTYFEAVAFAYGDAMVLEARLMDPGQSLGQAEFDAILRRSQPLVLPAAAVLDVVDRWDRLGLLEQLVHHGVRAGQLVGDLVDCREDLAEGNHTWVVRRLGGLEGAPVMTDNLVRGGFDAITGEALDDLGLARDAAEAVPLPAAVDWIERRAAGIDHLRQRFYAALFDAIDTAAAKTTENVEAATPRED